MTTYFFKHLNESYNIFLTIICFFICTFITCYIFKNQLIYILIKPLFLVTESNYLIITELIEIFKIQLLLIFFISFVLSLWYSIIAFWFFLAPGLYKEENLKIFIYLIFLILSFIWNNYFIFSYIIPYIWKFFILFQNIPYDYLYNFYFEPKFSTYLLSMINIIFWINLLIQYPILILSLLIFKILTINWLIKNRRFIYFQICVLSALLTPPDIISQLIISLLFIVIIEVFLIIFIVKKQFKIKSN